MILRISHAELLQTAMKALEGTGLPLGLDRDAARNIVWLQARGFDGIGLLAAAVSEPDRQAGWNPPAIEDDGFSVRIRATRASGIILAPGAIDLLYGRRSVAVPNCRASLMFVAEAARRSCSGSGFHIEITAGTTSVTARCHDGEASLYGEIANTSALVMLRHNCNVTTGHPTTIWDVDQFQNGFQVESQVWGYITTSAKRVLVPSGPRSRGGAGAEVDDSA